MSGIWRARCRWAATDRRVRRTRQLLRRALVELILEKGYDRITVQHIIDPADVGRSTFCAHYIDKDDLLLGNLEELAAAFEEHMERHFASRAEPNPVLAAFQHADRQRDLYKALAGKRGAEVMRAGLRRRIKEVMARRIPEFLPHRDGAVPVDVTMEFLLTSLLGLLVWWLDNDVPYTAQEMAEMYMRLIVPGVQAAYGI
ncbi:TetR/AcrR family transcriptional regulator [Nonomuraea sp. 3N208]|uniref:TetR/AcrR family transcriptional regulator n=1 Tax=Nonomuraea sp. 3N208 TaxID=3457421 RepID=UPI003FD3169D